MKLIDHRWVHAVWCDDIRQEMGNKPSLMGVYFNELVLPVMPTVVPKLCVLVQLGTPRSKPFKKLAVRVTRSDAEEPLATLEIPDEHLLAVPLPPIDETEEADPPRGRGLSMNFVMQMGPLELTEATKWLKVWVDTEDEALESFKLRITSTALLATRYRNHGATP